MSLIRLITSFSCPERRVGRNEAEAVFGVSLCSDTRHVYIVCRRASGKWYHENCLPGQGDVREEETEKHVVWA